MAGGTVSHQWMMMPCLRVGTLTKIAELISDCLNIFLDIDVFNPTRDPSLDDALDYVGIGLEEVIRGLLDKR